MLVAFIYHICIVFSSCSVVVVSSNYLMSFLLASFCRLYYPDVFSPLWRLMFPLSSCCLLYLFAVVYIQHLLHLLFILLSCFVFLMSKNLLSYPFIPHFAAVLEFLCFLNLSPLVVNHYSCVFPLQLFCRKAIIFISGWDLAEWFGHLTAHATVATVLGSMSASSDTLESDRQKIKQRWI
jgi:hypothetical protein